MNYFSFSCRVVCVQRRLKRPQRSLSRNTTLDWPWTSIQTSASAKRSQLFQPNHCETKSLGKFPLSAHIDPVPNFLMKHLLWMLQNIDVSELSSEVSQRAWWTLSVWYFVRIANCLPIVFVAVIVRQIKQCHCSHFKSNFFELLLTNSNGTLFLCDAPSAFA